MVKKILHSWVFWVAVLIGLLGGASFWLPYLGILIAPLTIVSAVLQGYENQRTQEDINTKHAQAISQIQTTQNDISTKHAEAMREIAQAREEAANQHTEALREIDQARKEAARQYDEATQEIKRAKEEALLLIKWVPRVWIFIYSVADKLVTPTVLDWIRRRTSKE